MAAGDSQRRCLDDGLLVCPDFPLPSDPGSFYVRREDVTGCNRLRCSACGADVRHFDRFRLEHALRTEAEAAALFATADAAAQPLLEPDTGGDPVRVYACRCSAEQTASLVRLSLGDRPVAWACAGHPASA